MDMDSNSCKKWPNPKRLKTLASNVRYAKRNNLLHQFVLDNSPPHQSRSESYLNAHLLTISSSSLNVNAFNKEGYSPLHLAVLKNNVLMTKKLLSCLSNIDVNAECNSRKNENTALHLAAMFGNLDIVEALLDKGASIDLANWNGNTALHLAANLGYLDIVEALLDKEASIDVKNGHDETALCLAVGSGHLGIIKLLVRKGANVNLKCRHTFPLQCAVGYCNLESVIFLVRNGADLSIRDRNCETVLHHAAKSGNLAIAEFLVNNGADVDAEDINGWTPLCYAARYGHLRTLKLLLDRGADLNTGEPLFRAIESRNLAVVESLVRKGANVNARDNSYNIHLDYTARTNLAKDFYNNNNTPLHHAVYYRDLEILQFLLNNGGVGDINAKNKMGETPLHLAIFNRTLEISKVLLDNGADVNAINYYGKTPLHYAVSTRHLGYVALLIDKGADVDAKDEDGLTPLHKAVIEESAIEVTKMLIGRGADVNATDKDGKAPLHHVLDRTEFCIECRESDAYLIRDGRTPLHHLERYECDCDEDDTRENLKKIRLLLEGNADVNLKDKNEETPLCRAMRSKNSELIELFSGCAS